MVGKTIAKMWCERSMGGDLWRVEMIDGTRYLFLTACCENVRLEAGDERCMWDQREKDIEVAVGVDPDR